MRQKVKESWKKCFYYPIVTPPVGVIGVGVRGGWFTVCVDGVGVVVPTGVDVDVDEPELEPVW